MQKINLCNGCPRFEDRGLAGKGDKPCDILFLSSNPSEYALNKGQIFMGPGDAIIRRALSELAQEKALYRNVTRYMAYAVRCGSHKIDKESLDHCSPIVRAEIHAAKPKVIVPLGNDAAKQAGVKSQSITKIAGRESQTTLDGVVYKVLPTLHPFTVVKEPGLYTTFKDDIRKAIDYAFRENIQQDREQYLRKCSEVYSIPTTAAEAIEVCKLIKGYTGLKNGNPDDWVISVDVETNTLLPHAPNAKVIMISIAWDDGKATAIVLDHKDATYNWADIRPYLVDIISGPKPKTFHNAKFDIKFIEHVLGIPVNNLKWDSMLAEHLLDEAKKGYYGLKVLTRYYTPNFVGYENKVKEYLNTQAEALNEDESDEDESTEREELVASESSDVTAVSTDEGLPDDLTERLQFCVDKGKTPRKRRGILRRKKTNLSAEEGAEMVELSKTISYWEIQEQDTKKLIQDARKRAKIERSKGDSATYEDIPLQTLLLYAAIDADITRRITKAQVAKFSKELLHVLNTYALPGSRVLGRMELDGFAVDKVHLAELESNFTTLRNKYELEAYATAGKTFNLNSSKELPNVLYMDMGLPIIKTSDKTGAPSSDKATLAALGLDTRSSDVGKELCKTLLNYRECDKALHGFLRGKTGIHELSQLDGLIHTQFNINGTSTGRLSSARKNLQNLPKYMHELNIKKLFTVQDKERDVVVNMDYSGAELRVLAAYAPDADLISALRDPAQDIHSLFAHRISKATAKVSTDVIPYRDIVLVRMPGDVAAKILSEEDLLYRESILHKLPEYDEARRKAKRVVFGTLYGMTRVRLSKELDITEDEAQQIIDGLMLAFPTINEYIESTKDEVKSQGYVETRIGRRRRFPLRSMSGMFNAAVREAVNFKIQSTASDIVFGQLIEIASHIQELGGKVRITVHDSIVFTMPKANLPRLRAFLDIWALNRVAERYPWMPVPMRYDVEVGPSYGELTDLDTYLSATT